VAEGAMVVVETTASPGEEEGDGGSPGAGVDEVTVAVTILRLIIGAELATVLREYKALFSVGKLQTLDMPIAYCDFMSSLGRSSL
jgi:hypothetical protein